MLKDFRVFQLATDYYQRCQTLRMPQLLKEQLIRASSSIALNIAEGSRRFSAAEQRRFYLIAFGSLRETQAILLLEKVQDPELENLGNQLGAILFKLCRKPKTSQL